MIWVASRHPGESAPFFVIPAKAGIQLSWLIVPDAADWIDLTVAVGSPPSRNDGKRRVAGARRTP
ncbi:MAG TPA: hypothetical protein VGF77_06630 [Allosphingosinicella sp.]|jgi:hypothetical protein